MVARLISKIQILFKVCLKYMLLIVDINFMIHLELIFLF